MDHSNQTIDKVNEMLPLGKLTSLGLQHVLALYAGAISVPLIIGGALGFNHEQMSILIAADLFTCGIATLVQSFGIGASVGIKLPIMMGCAFSAINPIIAIGKSGSITDIYGSIIISGLLIVIMAPVVGKLTKFFPPVVTGSIITIIGIILLPSALKNAGGGAGLLGTPEFGNILDLSLAFFVIVIILLMNKFFKGFLQALSVLMGIIIGTIVAALLGHVDFTPVAEAGWIKIVTPFAFGFPTFHLSGVITMSILSLVMMVESTGTFMGIAKICGRNSLTDQEITAGLRAEGIGNILGGIFNSFPYMSYTQNIGLVALTKVTSRFVIITAAIMVMILGMLPKFTALATIIPLSVFGGAMLVMFSMVIISGVNILRDADLSENSNMLTAALSIGIGAGTALVPDIFQNINQHSKVFEMVFGHGGIVLGAIIAVFSNLLLNYNKLIQKEMDTPTESNTGI